MNIDKEDKIQLAMHNAEVISDTVQKHIKLHEKLEAKGKSPEYILIYGQGYAEGVYDTKTELQPKISELNKELETYKKIIETAEKIKCRDVSQEHCNKYSSKECSKCIIDWARKEVRNEHL